MRHRLSALAAALVLVGCDDGSKPGSGSGSETTTVANTAPITVGFGALGPSGQYVNGLWASVTVCVPGTTNCQTIPNVLVDTGSFGLRLLSSALTIPLPGVSGTDGNPLQECVSFADFSYTWGPVAYATVQIPGTGESASAVPGQKANTGVPIQILAANPSFPVPASCLPTAPVPSMAVDVNTVETLGANGILGIGLFAQDCGGACAGSTSLNQYFTCPNGQCGSVEAPVQIQVWNPVSAFSSPDNNGVAISLPSTGAGGAPSVNGSMIFGVGTQADNSIGSAQIFEVDQYGNFPQVVFNGTTYASPNNGSFVDTGSNGLFFSDAASLASSGIVECNGNFVGYYCPSSTLSFSVTVQGTNGVQTAVPFNIANAANLFGTGQAAFSNLGGDSGTGPSTDYVDLGIPFFFGRTVFLGIAGTNRLYPNGFWAF
jgi:uncharacterized protein DUF3443